MDRRLKAGIIGATGMVGQRFITLLQSHPWFEVTLAAASAKSAGKTYAEAVQGRWAMAQAVPESVAALTVQDASRVKEIAEQVDFIFCAVDMAKDQVLALEEAFARAETPVVSNNSAARAVADVPMLIPEINYAHLGALEAQKKRLGTKRGFIVVKPNCSLQSYVPAIHPLLEQAPDELLFLHMRLGYQLHRLLQLVEEHLFRSVGLVGDARQVDGDVLEGGKTHPFRLHRFLEVLLVELQLQPAALGHGYLVSAVEDEIGYTLPRGHLAGKFQELLVALGAEEIVIDME